VCYTHASMAEAELLVRGFLGRRPVVCQQFTDRAAFARPGDLREERRRSPSRTGGCKMVARSQYPDTQAGSPSHFLTGMAAVQGSKTKRIANCSGIEAPQAAPSVRRCEESDHGCSAGVRVIPGRKPHKCACIGFILVSVPRLMLHPRMGLKPHILLYEAYCAKHAGITFLRSR